MRRDRPTDDNRPLTTITAAAIIGCAPDTVRWMARTGRLKATQLESGLYLYDRADVEAAARARARRKAS